MIRNYLLIGLRNICKYKLYSFVNVVGLSIGVTCSLLILLFVQFELSYDRYHHNADRIYRVLIEGVTPLSSDGRLYPRVPAPLGKALSNHFREILGAVRFFKEWKVVVSSEKKKFYEDSFYFTDPSVFKVFDFILVQGSTYTALREPNSIVITEKIAQKYFEDRNPVGQTLTLDNQHTFKVTGILRNLPQNSHFEPDFLASNSTLEIIKPSVMKWSPSFGMHATYLLLAKDVHPNELEQKLAHFITRGGWPNVVSGLKLHLQPLTHIHFSSLLGDFEPGGDILYIYVFSVIAGLILIIACINFINLTITQSISRTKEVGMRKVFGADRMQIVKQFLGESVLVCGIAFLIALMLARELLPVFSDIIQVNLTFEYVKEFPFLLLFAGSAIVVGLLSGVYPAFWISSFPPVQAIKDTIRYRPDRTFLRKGLVFFQFAISITIIVFTIAIYRQVNYLQSKNVGFDRNHAIRISFPFKDKTLRQNYYAFKNELLRNPYILGVASGATPFGEYGQTSLTVNGQKVTLTKMWIDYDYVETLRMNLLQGRNFSPAFSDQNSVILNETAVKVLGIEDPIGKHPYWNERYTIVGIVNDFHFASLHSTIGPVILVLRDQPASYLVVRFHPLHIQEAIAYTNDVWKSFVPSYPFEYSFFDDIYENQYKVEERFQKIVLWFSLLAISIACLGLFGLFTFILRQRKKEIGIRKVLGASVFSIFTLLLKDFLNIVVLANVVSWPIALYVTNRWLQNFSYRTPPDLSIFISGGGAVLVIALLTVGLHTFKAAAANPVNALRYE